MKKNIVFRATEKQQQFIDAVLSGKYTVLLFGGAIRGGKTFVALAIAILLCKIYPKSRWAIVRKDLKRLKNNTRPSLDKFLEGSGVKINESDQTFTFANGSTILFIGENYDKDKTLERFKGMEVNGFIGEEVSEIRYETFKKFIERAGSYLITPTPAAGQPPPLIIMTCNPTQTWIKQEIYDKWKNGTLPANAFYLASYVTDNPYLEQAYLDNIKNLPLYEYKVFVEGNWDVALKAENAFWHAFDINKHLGLAEYNNNTTVHVSIDANTLPYCSATIWQIYPNDKKVLQIAEITAADPFNHASGLGQKVSEYLNSTKYDNVVYIYGDATTKNQNAIDEKKRSFFDIFTEQVKKEYKICDYMGKSNPQVALTGEFVNALLSFYDGWQILISETCKTSINDYLSVKKDADGTMLKTRVKNEAGQSYEEHGHISDTLRYFLYTALSNTFGNWKNRFSPPHKAISVSIDKVIGDDF